MYPSPLFVNVAKSANSNESLNTDLAAIFAAIEASASGYPSEQDIKGLFADFDTTSNRLGNTVKDKNKRLADVLKGVAGLEFGDFEGSQIDLFGDRSEEHTSELQSRPHLVCRLLLEKKKTEKIAGLVDATMVVG